MGQNIVFDIIARDKASETFDRISKHSEHSAGRLKKFGLVAAGAFAATGVAAVSAGVEFTKMAAEDEASAKKLARAMQNNAHATTGQIASTEKWISAQGRAYGIANEELRPALTQLVAATHDVGQAQKLASLAMNISAGTGRSLQAVSLALAKAQNGNVSGLGRLGIATKNASGKTKTFDQILRGLSKTFKGQAATSANTMQGKMNRLKVAMHETGVSIGYELLPVATKLANWMLNDAIPAVDKFAHQMHDGSGAGGEVARVLRDVAGAGKGALGVLNAIPGPVKRFGVEGLLAYVAIRKLSGATSMLGSSLVSPIAKTKQFYAEMTYAETRMGTISSAASKLGPAMRQLGGAAGMLAVADGAKRSNYALSTLEMTAGAAAAGFAVGGPVGAAVGGAVGYLGALAKMLRDDGKAAKDTLPTFNQYAATLDGVGAATSRATREMVFERLTKSGLLAQTQALNISDRDAIQAAMGNEAARRRVSAALAEAVAQGHNYEALQIAQHLGAETSAIQSSRVAQLEKNLALAGTKEEAQRIQEKLDRLARTNASPTISLMGADAAISKLNSIMQLIHDIKGTKGGNAQLPAAGSVLAGLSGHNATGTRGWRGGLSWVGEQGPELMNLPRGSQVYTASESARMAAGGSGGATVVEVHLHLDGETIVRQIKARNYRKGVATASL